MTDDRIHVKVHSYGPGRPLALVYFDKTTGKKVARSADTTDRDDALRAAGAWEDKLNSGRYVAPSRITWSTFRERFQAERLAGKPESTQEAYRVALDHVERTVNPDRLVKLTPPVLSQFQADLRAAGMKDTTIARHLRHVKAALNWAERVGLLAKAPKMEMPKLAGQTMMRGRPVTGEEFDRLIAAVPKVRPDDARAWQRYLRALWLSGLRLDESLAVSWDQDAPFAVDLTGRRPVFRIYAEAHKARRDEVLPMTPDFAEWLLTTPEAERVGPVFRLTDRRTGKPLTAKRAGLIVGKIGAAAKVVISRTRKKVWETVKVRGREVRRKVEREVPLFATAHDLRRAFGTRWATRVRPPVLQRLMRHANISTTMRFYVALDASDVADELWANYGPAATNGNSGGRGNNLATLAPNGGENAEGASAVDSTETPLPQDFRDSLS